jgi:SAM-dependent methyltransferase
MADSEFDQYASDYERALQQGLSVSGESSDYFAVGRVRWLRKRLEAIAGKPLGLQSAMDFGCGTGNSVASLLQELQLEHVIGLDTSEQSLVQARSRYPATQTEFVAASGYTPNGSLDMAYCNGVFHHIPVASRLEAVEYIFRSLRPGGWFAFWENNPWNPGTRMVMRRIPFDHDAITLTIPESVRLLRRAGFAIRKTDTCFYFPNSLRFFRPLEPYLAWMPLGAQYLVLAQKPI